MNKNLILETEIKGLKVSKVFTTDTTETLLVSLQEHTLFPTHTSPKNTLLVVLKGKINFHIEDKTITLAEHQTYTFKKGIEHYVDACKDSKFLIIR